MDPFVEALCQTIATKAKHGEAPTTLIGLENPKCDAKKLREKMETMITMDSSTVVNIEKPDSCPEQSAFFLRKYIGWILLTILLAFFVLFVVLLAIGYWQVGFIGLVIVTLPLAIALLARSDTSRPIAKLYTLCLVWCFYFMKVPKEGGRLSKSKIMFITRQEASESILERIPSTLCKAMKIPNIEKLSAFWKKAKESENNINHYGYVRNLTKAFGRDNEHVPWLIVFVFFVICFVSFFACFIIYEIDLAASGVTLLGIGTLFYKFIYPIIKPKCIGDEKLDNVTKLDAVGKICRMHQLIAKEKIIFILIADDNDDSALVKSICGDQQMMKFVVVMHNGAPSGDLKYHYRFDLKKLVESPLYMGTGYARFQRRGSGVTKCLKAGVKALKAVKGVPDQSFILNGIEFMKRQSEIVGDIQWEDLNVARHHLSPIYTNLQKLVDSINSLQPKLDDKTIHLVAELLHSFVKISHKDERKEVSSLFSVPGVSVQGKVIKVVYESSAHSHIAIGVGASIRINAE